MFFQQILQQINTAFDNVTENIIINQQEFKELIDVEYSLNSDIIQELSNHIILPNSIADQDERNNIIQFFKDFDFITDPNTRQAVLQLKYDNDPLKASCIPCIQVIIRNEEIKIFVFFRSSNYQHNFLYDNQTFCILMKMLSQQLNKKIGIINIKIISLHQPIS